jgi:hypothetical protein
MAGEHGGVVGPIKMRNPGLLMDVRLAPGGTFTQEVPEVSEARLRGWVGRSFVLRQDDDHREHVCSGQRTSLTRCSLLFLPPHVRAGTAFATSIMATERSAARARRCST